MSAELQGKRIVITGAGGGIGRATAAMAASRGASVLCTDVDPGSLDETVRLVHAASPSVKVLGEAFDCADLAAVREGLASAVDSWGGFDVLVNVAGVMFAKPLADCELEDLERIFRVNVGGMLVMSRAIAPWLPAGSVIVNVGSSSAQHLTPGLGIYGASKAANIYLTRAFALEYAERGVRVCGVGPGAVDTAFPRSGLPPGEEGERLLADAVAGAQLLPRMAQPEEIAHAIGYLLSDDAAFVVGSTLWIDGGCTAAF